MKICALLLAKGKSSFKHKNIYPALSNPLMAYPMLAAKNVDLISERFFSSYSKKYLKITNKHF
jgi:CMP-N-acetylneuraminic acid synthetase